MDIKIFLVSPIVEYKYPRLVVWADDAKASLEAASDFISGLRNQKPVVEPLSKDFQTLQGAQESEPPAELSIVPAGQVVHFQFHKNSYYLIKNKAVLVKTQDILEPIMESPPAKVPVKRSLFRRLFDYV